MTVHAIFQDGVFKPTQPVELAEGTVVTFDPIPNGEVKREETALEQAIRELTSRTPEEILADRERLLAKARPGRPLPPGKTLADVVEGQWPGDETDEEIRIAMEKLS
jgi:predicted DNA-binding antitoxin AbrB/MazE fold protein